MVRRCEPGVETVRVEVGAPYLRAADGQSDEHPVADRCNERLLRRVAVHDERPGHRSAAISRSTLAANSSRAVSVEVSIA